MTDDMRNRPIYLDNQATTPVDPRVLDAMLPYFQARFGNPHSQTHFYGWEAAEAVEVARGQLAEIVNASPEEIIFTSGATESNNLAIKGVARFYKDKKKHLVTCTTEHMCVLDSAFQLEKEGFEITYLPVSRDGLIDLDELRAAIRDDTVLVTIMTVQNEVGVIQPMAEIGAICHEKKVFLHSDAAQAVGKVPVDVKALNIDLLSFTGHKLYGPMGIGALYVGAKPKVRLEPLISGGGQEQGIRPGTLPAPLCVGFGEACRVAAEDMAAENKRLSALRGILFDRLRNGVPGVRLNGDLERRIPGNLNIAFDGVDGESLMAAVPEIAVSSGSACSSEDSDSSHVLSALGLTREQAHSSLRFGIGRFTTEEEIETASARIIDAVKKLRRQSGNDGAIRAAE
ncbi:MAG: IscS subfamily cysteine desulfurase [Proteobacteria bacterium]|nr:IscS subfamily cysteine desulfurase [Pseudomonadota bacterium]